MNRQPSAARSQAQRGNQNVKRGSALENLLLPMFRSVPNSSITKTSAPFHVLKVVGGGPIGKPMFHGVFARAGQCDFVGHYRGVHVEIEAKRHRSEDGPFNFKAAIKDHQAERLSSQRKHGCLSGLILMYDEGCRIYAMDWIVIEAFMAAGRKSIGFTDLDPMIGGVRCVHSLIVSRMDVFLADLYNKRNAPWI